MCVFPFCVFLELLQPDPLAGIALNQLCHQRLGFLCEQPSSGPCLFPLHLLGLVYFDLAPSSAVCFSVFSFCLSYCVWGLRFAGCRFVVPVVFVVCPLWLRLVQWVVQASWWRGLVPVFWWMRLDLVFLVGTSTSVGMFWGVCGLIMILGSLSANGWGCVPVLLVVWHRVSSTVACWLLSEAGS